MPLCPSPRSFISKVVSIKRNKITKEGETCIVASKGKKQKR
jgi:hypothetical protein